MTLALLVALFTIFVIRTVASGALGSTVALTANALSGGLFTGGSVQAVTRLGAVKTKLARGTFIFTLIANVARLTGRK